jgi:CHAT domain-containing protein
MLRHENTVPRRQADQVRYEPADRAWVAALARQVPRRIARLRPGATVLTGQAVTPAATLAAMDGASVVHVAAHGTHQPDNALFSGLELSGGPLMGYPATAERPPPPWWCFLL